MPPNDPPIRFILIPQNGTPMKIIEEKTTNITMDKTCSTFPMGHIPDVREIWKHSNKAWAGRTICFYGYGRENKKPEGVMEGTWVLLMNKHPKSEFALNMHPYWSKIENRRVWGDAFLCKLGKNAIIHGRAQYVNVMKAALEDKEFKWMMENAAILTSRGHTITLDADGNYSGTIVSKEAEDVEVSGSTS